MAFTDSIFSLVWDISDFFYNAYSEVRGWVWPFYLLHYPLYSLSKAFWDILTPIAHLGDWIDDVAIKVTQILSYQNIWEYFNYWFRRAEWSWEWIFNAWLNVTSIISTWWSSTALTVQGWVNEAKQYAASLVNQANTWLATLQSAWDSFKGKIPTIDAVIAWWGNLTANILLVVNNWWKERLLDVQVLINSAFTVREGLWSGWQDWRGKVAEFFTDPVEFIWQRFADWFLGPEG